jgi:hypothetical protein
LIIPFSYIRVIGITIIIIGVLFLRRFQGKTSESQLEGNSVKNSFKQEEIKGI